MTTRAAPWSRTQSDRRVVAPDQAWAHEKLEMLRGGCHPPQLAFVDDPSRLVAAIVGREGGKSRGLFVRLAKPMLTIEEAETIFVCLTRETAKNILWKAALKILDRIGVEYRPSYSLLQITLKRNGSRLSLIGADDEAQVDKLRGWTTHGAAIDEAAAFKAKLLRDLIERAITPRLHGALSLASTPAHVLSGPFFDATADEQEGKTHRPYRDRDAEQYANWRGFSSHFWSLADPLVHGFSPELHRAWQQKLDWKADLRLSDDNPVWLREGLGKWQADDTGRVFQYSVSVNQWDPPMKGPKYGEAQFAELPDLSDQIDKWKPDWEYIIAMDQGHADPFAACVFALSPTDPKRRIWHVYGFGRVKFFANLVAKLMLGEELNAERPGGILAHTGWPAAHVWDADQAHIDELATVYGVRTTKADRKPEYKFGAVELVNGDLVDGRIFVLKGSLLEKQLLELQWKVNDLGQLKEDPAQRNDHTDCLIYGRLEIANLFTSGKVGGGQPPPAYRDPMGLDDFAGDESNPASSLWGNGNEDDDPWG